MVMIPLPFVFALLACWGLWRVLLDGGREDGWFYPVICLAGIALQMVIIGTRFGYGVQGLASVQPFLGVILPPLIWMSFRRPETSADGLVHLWPLAGLGLIVLAAPDWQDGFVAIVALIYAGALIRVLRQGEAGLAWVTASQVPKVRGLAKVAVGILGATALTDAAAPVIAMMGRQDRIGEVVGVAMLMLAAAIIAAQFWRRQLAHQPIEDGYAEVFSGIEHLMQEDKIYRDPDLTLGRIARKLHLPVKAVSRAVNGSRDMNVSQYINGYRVAEACERLSGSDQAVTAILYEVGFNTKSNFNREFVRIMGVTPSAFRRSEGPR
jgi:AraC-like DNA-binding protein